MSPTIKKHPGAMHALAVKIPQEAYNDLVALAAKGYDNPTNYVTSLLMSHLGWEWVAPQPATYRKKAPR